jgi:hypothetical protein
MSTRDHILGWHHAAQLIADSMPAPVKRRPVRLVPVFEFDRTGIPDVDPVKAASLKRRAKEAEQAAFEVWLARVRPSGDVESVQQHWEDSSDYADLMEDLEEPGQAPAAALGDAWIDWSPGMTIPTTRASIRLMDCMGGCRDVDGVLPSTYPEEVFTWPKNSPYMRCVAFRLIPTEAA